MSALEVRTALQARGFDFSKYTSNPLSSIHTTLKRIKDSGQAEDKVVSGATVYKWKTIQEDPAPRPVRGRVMLRRYGEEK